MTASPSPLESSLAELRRAPVPSDLADVVMDRVVRERRPLGLGTREWAVIGASLGTFTVALQVMVSWASGMLQSM